VKALEELKELEARREELPLLTKHALSLKELHDKQCASVYRRLCLDLAKVVEEKSKLMETSVIFDPTDPRVEIDREYEFSNGWDFTQHTKPMKLEYIEKGSAPFVVYPYENFTFIRLPKRGGNV
jgi:hypothetical protein